MRSYITILRKLSALKWGGLMRGIDVSYHQGKIDWKTVKTSGIEFAIIRAGYGDITDTRFVENITNAQSVGIKVGVYWFSYALDEADAKQEAIYCYNAIKPYKLDLPVFYDFEYDTERYAMEHEVTYNKAKRTAVIKAFCDRMEDFGYHCGIYLNPDYIKYRLNFDELRAYPLWLANWHDEEQTNFSVPKNEVTIAYGKPFMWQFGKGYVLGIEGDVDLNYGYFEKETDNEPSEWSKEAIEWAVKNKILQGDENGDYKLREPCTTERFITLLHRAIKTIKLNIGE